MELFNLISLAVIFGVAMLLLYRQGIFRDKALLVCALVLTAAAMLIRGFYFDVQSDDYTTFLAPWTQFFRDNGGFKALAFFPGNYNPPYMYFLAAFSYFGISELYLIKLLSVLFDVLLAWSCMKLLSLYTGSKAKQLGVFLAVLYLPTVVTNGAYWAQCDSIYAFFGIFALYLGLSEKGVGAMISLAACLAFKLQAVFIIPVFFVLLLAKKLRWTQLLIFPAAYIVFMLPAVIAGAPLWDTLTLYFSQAGTVGDAMNYNAPSLTSMFSWSGDTTQRRKGGLSSPHFCSLRRFMLRQSFCAKSCPTALYSALRLSLQWAYPICCRICTTGISSFPAFWRWCSRRPTCTLHPYRFSRSLLHCIATMRISTAITLFSRASAASLCLPRCCCA